MHTFLFTLICSTVCSPEGAIRLVNGSSPMEGRVEYCSNGVWGTVSGDGFDSLSLQVVCQSALASMYAWPFITQICWYMMKLHYASFRFQVCLPGVNNLLIMVFLCVLDFFSSSYIH